jgi:ribosomal protein S18 acetylase RimI-like enzyme
VYHIIRCDNGPQAVRRYLSQVNALYMRLNPDGEQVSFSALMDSALKCSLLLCLDDQRHGSVAGMGMLSVVPSFHPYGIIDNVVVHERHEGKGVGRMIMEELIKDAKACKLHHIDLTSKPSRERANKLYPKVGFELRETNVYRLNLSSD